MVAPGRVDVVDEVDFVDEVDPFASPPRPLKSTSSTAQPTKTCLLTCIMAEHA